MQIKSDKKLQFFRLVRLYLLLILIIKLVQPGIKAIQFSQVLHQPPDSKISQLIPSYVQVSKFLQFYDCFGALVSDPIVSHVQVSQVCSQFYQIFYAFVSEFVFW